MKKLILLGMAFASILAASAQNAATFRQWGNESLEVIDAHLRNNATQHLYDEDLRGAVAYAWPMGIQLKALIYADRIADAEALYAEFHTGFYYNANGYGAYNAVYKGTNDRYYDDNAWIAKDLMDLYDKTGKALYLDRAKTILAFCMSGECPTGGIRFHESHSNPTNENYYKWATCATAPTACVNLRIYKATKNLNYLDDGRSLYNFMKSQIWGIGPGYRGYENAVVMEAAILLYQITGEAVYLKDAQWIGHAMETRYIAWQSRRLNEVGCWGGHDMTDAYVNMWEVDHDQNWLNIVAGYLKYLHDNCKDDEGFYPETWNDTERDGKRFLLLDQASAASAFLKMSLTPGGQVKLQEPVAIFQDIDWNKDGEGSGCWSMGLKVGNYTQEDLTFMGLMNNRFAFNHDISSIRVAPGYKVTLYSQNNFQGTSKVYTSDINYMYEWNDKAYSLKVEALYNAAPVEKQEEDVSAVVLPSKLIINHLQAGSSLDILNLAGHTIFSTKATESSLEVNTSTFAAGIYLLRVGTAGSCKVLKIKI